MKPIHCDILEHIKSLGTNRIWGGKMAGLSMSKRVRFVLTLLAVVVIVSATVFLISRFKAGADTLPPSTYQALGSKTLMTDMVKSYTTRKTTYETWIKEGQISQTTATRVENELDRRKYVNEKALIATFSDSIDSSKLAEYTKDVADYEQNQAAISKAILMADQPNGQIQVLANTLILPSSQVDSPKDTSTTNSSDAATINDPQVEKQMKDDFTMAQASAVEVYKNNAGSSDRIAVVADEFRKSDLGQFASNQALPLSIQTRLREMLADNDKLFSFISVSPPAGEALFDYSLGLTNKNNPLDALYGDGAGSISKFLDQNGPLSNAEVSQLTQNNQTYSGILAATGGDPTKLEYANVESINLTPLQSAADLTATLSNGDPDKFQAGNEMLSQLDSQMKMDDMMNKINNLPQSAPVIEQAVKSEKLRNIYKSSISINSNTGHVEYTSAIKQKVGENGYKTVGYISFDPVTHTVDASLPIQFGSKTLTLFSDPRVGDVYIELGNANGSSLLGEGKIALMTVSISQSGKIGGQFRLFNRLFAYNPNSGAFEMPIKLGNRVQFTIDTKGNVRGNIGIFGDANSSSQGSLFFDRNGNMGITLDLRTATSDYGRITTASIMYSKDGGIAGSLDLGKIIGGSNASSFFISVDKSGITGVNIPFGSWAGRPFGIGIGTNGSLSIGGFIPIAGLPIPVGITQDSSGGFRLAWPGGSLGIIKGDPRPQTPPELKTDSATGNYDASCVYYRHSFKKLFMTVRVYQVPCETIDKTEQIARGDMIMKVYSELLGRNPSMGEFLNWYFYSGHELYAYPDQNQKDYRMTATEAALRKVIKTGPYKNMSDQFKFPDKAEYDWIKSGKDPLAFAKRPKDILDKNPFSDGSLNDSSQKGQPSVNDLVSAINSDAKADKGGVIDQTGLITNANTNNQSSTQTSSNTSSSTSSTATNNTSQSNQNASSTTSSTATPPASSGVSASPIALPTVVNDVNQQIDKQNQTIAQIIKDKSVATDREKTVQTITTSLAKDSLSVNEKQMADKLIELANQQVEAEKQIAVLLDKIVNRSSVTTALIGPDNASIDAINKAQIDNNVRIKALTQVATQITDPTTADNVYVQAKQLEQSNKDLQQTVDNQQSKFSFFGWIIKLFNGIFG